MNEICVHQKMRAGVVFAGLFFSMNLHAQTFDSTVGGAAILQPGDEIRITVWRNAELSGDFAIRSDGTINHPLYKEVQVTEVPLKTLEERLRTFLGRYVADPQFVFLPIVKVVVQGEVRQPNLLSVPLGTTVSQAIGLAGGPSERARLEDVRLVRGASVILIDLTRPDSRLVQTAIRSGDQIVVGRQGASLRDYISPLASTIAAVAAIITVTRHR